MKSSLRSVAFGLVSFSVLSTASVLASDGALKTFECDSKKEVISKDNIKVDKKVSEDGNGALKVTAKKPTTFKLFEVSGLNVDNAKLLYKAKVKTKNIKGKAYLEMWCHFPGYGEYFSRGLVTPLTGTNDWSMQEIPFLLKKDQKPDLVKLNLVIDGTGVAWVDNIQLSKGTL